MPSAALARLPIQASQTQGSSNRAAVQTVDIPVSATRVTVALPLEAGLSGSITLHAASSDAALTISAGQPAEAGITAPLWHGVCKPFPPIVISNAHSHPITIAIDRVSVQLPCSVDHLLFGASSYQSNPIPQTLVSTKLGNATGSGRTITFIPTVSQLTIPANSAVTISVLRETSTAFVQLPAITNETTTLTSNAPTVPNSLALAFPSVQGGRTFQSACYLPSDPAGPGLGGIHVLGTPSFYCVLEPGETGASTTFGATNPSYVMFTLGPHAKPDKSLVGLDGPPIFAPCTPAVGEEVCNSPPFTIPLYSIAYVSNLADITACVSAVVNADCNGVAGNPRAPRAMSVERGKDFQLLFADDPSYSAANTFGGVTLHIGGTWPPCAIKLGADSSSDVPPGYSDPRAPIGSTPSWADFTRVGPYVEFDFSTRTSGTCSVNLTEDTGLKRSFVFQIAVKPKW